MPIAPLIGSALISSGANLLGGLMGNSAQNNANKANIQIARETNAANQQLQKDQNEWNLNQWNRENDYNSASAQRKRLEAAGMNPFLTSQQVAQGNATSNQLQSAPYTPTQAPTIQPVNALANGVANAGNDFVNTYLNTQMNIARVRTETANAKQAEANASAISGYKQDEAYSNIKRNQILSELTKAQTESQDIQNKLQGAFGQAQIVSQIELAQAQKIKTQSDKNLNYYQAQKINQDILESVARTNNIRLDYQQKREILPLMLESYRLKNRADSLQNDILQVDSSFEQLFGTKKRLAGYQQLEALKSISQKDNEYYGTRMFFDLGGKAAQAKGGISKK